MNKNSGNDQDNDSGDEVQIPILDDVVNTSETLKQVDLEPWEPDSYQPTPLEIETALESGEFDSLIDKLVDHVQADIHEQITNTMNQSIEEILQQHLGQCEKRIRDSIKAHLKTSLPDILKQISKAE